MRPIADESAFNDAAGAAIARVLAAEREARVAIEEARLEVGRIAERGRLADRALAERTERRIRVVGAAFERELAARLAEIEDAAERFAHPQPISSAESASLQAAVRALAGELVKAPP